MAAPSELELQEGPVVDERAFEDKLSQLQQSSAQLEQVCALKS